ncbi:MAG: transglutaminase family protein [Planctomyces sp.]|nr:transglutaminase family protein [Planctomyces sp.]
MTFHIQHTTRYTGSEAVSVGHNEAWLTPRATGLQRLLSHSLTIIPQPSVVSTRTDAFGNTVTQFSFNQGYDALTVTAVSDIELDRPAERPASDSLAWDAVAEALQRHESAAELEACEFLFDSPRCRTHGDFAAYAAPSFAPGRPIVEALLELVERFHGDFQFDPEATTVTTPVEHVFRDRRGVCQDFAHLLISIIRSQGLAARYISGYLRTLPPPGKPRLVGADASHAWASVYCGPLGWVDVDPVLGTLVIEDHVTVAWGRDYGDVAPLKGVYIGGGSHQLQVSVDVEETAPAGE